MQQPLIAKRADGRQSRWRARSAYALLLGVATALGLMGLSAGTALAAPAPGNATGAYTVPAGISAGDVQVELIATNGNGADSATISATGSSGTYTFSGVPSGQYYLYFNDTTAADNVVPDYYGDGGSDDIQKATPITIPAGGTYTTPTTEALGNGATISGTISDANATSEAGATVYINPVYTGADLDPQFFKYEDVTGANSYSISGLPAGTYNVEYTADGTNGAGVDFDFNVFVGTSGLTYDLGSATQYAIAAGSSTAINLVVPALGEVSGTVSGPSGPVNGDAVQFYDSLESYSSDFSFADPAATTYSLGDGTYSILLLPGTYKVNFGGMSPMNLASGWYGGASQAAATGVAVTAGGVTANINDTLTSGATISGTVVAAQGGAVLGGLDVELLDAQGNDIDDTFSQPNGTYQLTNVPAGTWYIVFNGGVADNGSYYSSEYYGGTQSEFGSTPITATAGQSVTGINGALLPAGTTALGMPKESGGALSGLHNNKVALKFNVAAGTGAGYLQSLTIGLPKHFSWNRSKLASDLSLGNGVTFTDAIVSGKLVVTFSSGQPSVSFSLKAGGITVTKAIEKAAGGTIKKKSKKKKKHALASAAKAKKKKTTKAKDTIKTETINLSVSDTTGVVTSLPFIIKKPH